MTADTHVGAIDQGTTGTRFMVLDHAGQVVANAYEKHEQIYPEPGWVEHDPTEVWESTTEVVTTGLEEGDLDAEQLAALGSAHAAGLAVGYWDDAVEKSLDWAQEE